MKTIKEIDLPIGEMGFGETGFGNTGRHRSAAPVGEIHTGCSRSKHSNNNVITVEYPSEVVTTDVTTLHTVRILCFPQFSICSVILLHSFVSLLTVDT